MIAYFTKKLNFWIIFSFSIQIANACTYTINTNIIQPSCGSNGILTISTTPAPSNGAVFKLYKNGSLLATLPGNSASLNSLAPGVYKVVVTHNTGGCTDSVDNIILDPAVNAISATYTVDSLRCDTSKNGRITIKHFNANMPVTYSWSHTNTEKDSIADNLVAGLYSVTLTDNSNCEFILKDMNLKEINQGFIFLDTIIKPSSCDSPVGKIDLLYANRHLPTFVWRQEPGTININFDSMNMPLDTLIAGKYSCYFTDTLKCHEYVAKDLEIVKNLAPSAYIVGTDSLCYNEGFGTLDVKFNSGDSTQMTYQWSSGQTTKKIIDALAGDYTVTVKDEAGCIDTPKWTIYNFPNRLVQLLVKTDQIVKGQELFITIDTPYGLYDIQWEPANKLRKTNNNAWVFPDVTTQYTMTAKYGPGCVTVANKTINIIAEKDDLVIPTMFTPNGDGRNDVYKMVGDNNTIETFEFHVYDRWGNAVFYTSELSFTWDGKDLKGESILSGVYTYLTKYSVVSEPYKKIVKSGTILVEK